MKLGNVLSVVGYRRTAEEAEADYARFCKLTKPLLTMGVFLAAWSLICFISLLIDALTGSYHLEIISGLLFYLLFAGLPVIVGIRGRALVPALLRGRLSWTGMAIVGLTCGVGSVLLSMLIGLPFLNPLRFEPQGLGFSILMLVPFLVFLAGPCTEETLYQVELQTALQRFGPIIAVIGTTLSFWDVRFWGAQLLGSKLLIVGLLFNQLPFLAGLIYSLLGCLTFGVIRQTTKSTGAAIIANSVANIILGLVHPAYTMGPVEWP